MTIDSKFKDGFEDGIPLKAIVVDCIESGGLKFSIEFDGEYYCTQKYEYCPKKSKSLHRAPYCRKRLRRH